MAGDSKVARFRTRLPRYVQTARWRQFMEPTSLARAAIYGPHGSRVNMLARVVRHAYRRRLECFQLLSARAREPLSFSIEVAPWDKRVASFR